MQKDDKNDLGWEVSRTVLGRPISNDVAALLDTLEQEYGCDITFSDLENSDIYKGGCCTVHLDGTPSIAINMQHPFWEDVIVHELHHLRLRKLLYPFFSLKNDVGSDLKKSDLELLRQLFFELYEPVLHYVFNPDIRAMGREPAVVFNPMFKQNLKLGEIEKNTLEMAWPLVYLRILLECSESDVQEQLQERCESLGWTEAMKTAKRIVCEFKSLEMTTPEKAVDVLIRSANIAFEQVYSFSVIEWVDVSKGPQLETKVRISVSLPEND